MRSLREWLASFTGLALVCLLALGLMAAGQVLAKDPPKKSPAPAATASKPFTTAEAQKLTADVLAKVESIRALKMVRKLDIAVKSRAELRRYLVERLKEEMPPEVILAAQKAYQRFGLIPRTMDLEAFMLDLLTEQIAGFYDEDAKLLFLMQETPLVLQKGVLAHEITHALQDAHFDLKRLDLDKTDNDDYVLAVKSLAEGDGIMVMVEYLTQTADAALMGDVQRMGETPGMASTAVLESAPDYIRSGLLFPYLSGVSFVTTLKGRGGWLLINEAYQHLPLSSEQILHPEKYLDKPDPPVLVSMADLSASFGAKWRSLGTNVMGEFGVRVLMRQFRLADKADAVAGGWGGDEYGVYEPLPAAGGNGGKLKTAIVWFTTWDSDSDAREFSDAYAALITQKYPEARKKAAPGVPPSGKAPYERVMWGTAQDDVCVERRQSDVLVVEGCPGDRVDAVVAAAWKAKKTRAAFSPLAITPAMQAQANPVDGLLKGVGNVPEGVGDLLTSLLQGQRSKGEVVGNLYRDYTYNFEISAPRPGWTVDHETPISMMPVMLTDPSGAANVNVAVFNMSLAPVESWAPMLEMMLPMQFQNFKKLSSGNITLNKLPAYEMHYSGTRDGVEARLHQIILVAEGKTFVITCGTLAQLYKDSEPDFAKILKSFRITKPAVEKNEDKPRNHTETHGR